MSKKKLQNEKPKQQNDGFWIAVVLIVCSYIVSIALIICAFCTKAEIANNNLYNSLGIACQVVASLCTCVLSILQISFSLQDNTFLGISVRVLYRMRKKPHFGFAANVLISLGFIIIAMLGYIAGSLYACTVAAISSILFCVYLIIIESPYLCMQDKTMLKIVCDRLLAEYNNSIKADNYQTAEVTEVLESLIKNKNLIWTYNRLSKAGCDDFDKYLLSRLMDVQTNIAFNLDKIESISQLSKVTDELLDTACAMASSKFDIVEILGTTPKDCLHNVTRVLFRLLDNDVSKDKTKIKIAEMVKWGSIFNKDNAVKSDLFFSIMTILIIETVKNNDFSLIKEVKKSLSVSPYFLREKGVTARIFVMVSFVLYYLSKIETAVPQDVKNNIDDLVQNSYIEDNCKVLSWKNLFSRFDESYSVSLENFLSDFSKNQHYYEFSLMSCDAHWVTFTNELAFDWYIATYLNSEKIYNIDYNTLFPIDSNPWMIYHLKEIENSCYTDDNRQFLPNERIKNMASFYSLSKTLFSTFSIAENHRHQLRDYIDSLRKKEFENKITSALVISNQDISNHFQPIIETKLKHTFGFDDKIDVSKEKKLYFALLTERSSDAVNYDECIIDWAVNSILYEIWNNGVKKYSHSIKTGNNFSQLIRKELLGKDVEYATPSTEYYVYEINDNQTQKEYLEKIKGAKVIDNADYLFSKPTFILKGGFAFNCKVQFNVSDLTPETISQKVDEYRRTDGQYVYEGAFLTREELSRIIKDTQVIFQVVFSYKISTYEDSIIILNENDDNDEDVDAVSDNEKTTNNSKSDNDESSDSDV